jgi:GT2 family glycosyltransferase
VNAGSSESSVVGTEVPVTSADPAPGISVVVCTRNRGNRIVRTIESILASELRTFELLVVDQSPGNETAESVSPFLADSRVRYVRTTDVGVGRARNTGLNLARAPLVAFTDDDVRVPSSWLSVMGATLDAHPRVAIVFCNVAAGPHDPAIGFIPAYVRPNTMLATRVLDKCRARGMGAGMAVRRITMLDLGGFDPDLGPGGRFPSCEEGDAALRALLAGHHVLETSEIAVVHDGFRTWDEGRALTRRDWYGIGAAYSKPIRAGRMRALPVVAWEGVALATVQPIVSTLQNRRPAGLRRCAAFWRGFARGLTCPVDRRTLLFRSDAGGGAR